MFLQFILLIAATAHIRTGPINTNKKFASKRAVQLSAISFIGLFGDAVGRSVARVLRLKIRKYATQCNLSAGPTFRVLWPLYTCKRYSYSCTGTVPSCSASSVYRCILGQIVNQTTADDVLLLLCTRGLPIMADNYGTCSGRAAFVNNRIHIKYR